MSSQLDKNQEIIDRLDYLERKIQEIEYLLQQEYEDKYDSEDL